MKEEVISAMMLEMANRVAPKNTPQNRELILPSNLACSVLTSICLPLRTRLPLPVQLGFTRPTASRTPESTMASTLARDMAATMMADEGVAVDAGLVEHGGDADRGPLEPPEKMGKE